MGGKWLPGSLSLFSSCKMSLMGCFDKHATVSLQTAVLCPLSCTNKPLPATHTNPQTSNTHHLPKCLYERQESKGIVGTVIPVIISDRKYHINHRRATRNYVHLCFTDKLRDSEERSSLSYNFCIFQSRQYASTYASPKENEQLINNNKKTILKYNPKKIPKNFGRQVKHK